MNILIGQFKKTVPGFRLLSTCAWLLPFFYRFKSFGLVFLQLLKVGTWLAILKFRKFFFRFLFRKLEVRQVQIKFWFLLLVTTNFYLFRQHTHTHTHIWISIQISTSCFWKKKISRGRVSQSFDFGFLITFGFWFNQNLFF